MFKKIFILIYIFALCIFNSNIIVYAKSPIDDVNNIFQIYTINGEKLFEKDNVEVGDSYIDENLKEFEIINVDIDKKVGIAKFVKDINIPKVTIKPNLYNLNQNKKTIAIYSTHNDESYVVGDGKDSIYGLGGINDVALEIKKNFENLGIICEYNNKVHAPHDTKAYSRSALTAKNLISKYSPNAIFDIHRDGASRKTYVTKYNGKDVCKVRMVVGKSNPNFDKNKEFAIYLLSVAKEIHPWLFLDIYMGRGHYNQNLSNKAMLFEMGSHLVEKELVLNSAKPLAEVVNLALFGTTIDDEGDITIGGNNDEPTIDEHFKDEKNKINYGLIFAITFSIIALSSLTVIFLVKKKISKK